MATGIDGTLELESVLRDATASLPGGPLARLGLYAELQAGLVGARSAEYAAAVAQMIARLGIWWSPSIYAALPVITPWAVRDRSCRYDAGPEAWGSPREDGCFRDDNSIVKKLPLSLTIAGSATNAYTGRKLHRGFTACHVWRDLPGGKVAGADQWLYSFVPNLVWLPSPLAPLTDQQGSIVQRFLQEISAMLYRGVLVAPPLQSYVARSWAMLPAPAPSGLPRPNAASLAYFAPSSGFFQRRLAYNEAFIAGINGFLGGDSTAKKVVSSRYVPGLAGADARSLAHMAGELAGYTAAARAASPALIS